MGAPLTIDHDEACRTASRLAELTGESLAEAVTQAIRERPDRKTQACDRSALERRPQGPAAEIRAHMQQSASSDHGWLHDSDPGTFGDCCADARARTQQAPLLFKGNDVSQTDVEPPLQG